MAIEDELKKIIKEKYHTISNFVENISMNNSTFSNIMKNGINNANITSIIKICNALDISTDELAEGRIVPREHLNSQNQFRDITLEVNLLFNSERNYLLDGKELSINEKETIKDILEIALNLIRRKRLKE